MKKSYWFDPWDVGFCVFSGYGSELHMIPISKEDYLNKIIPYKDMLEEDKEHVKYWESLGKPKGPIHTWSKNKT